jgi:phosphate transport system permease protein
MSTSKRSTRQIVEAGLARRRRKEFIFRTAGAVATAAGVIFLGVFFATLGAEGSSAFRQTFIKLDVVLSEDVLAPGGELDLAYADFDGIVRAALRERFPDVSGRSDRRRRLPAARPGRGGPGSRRHDPDRVGSGIVQRRHVDQGQH